MTIYQPGHIVISDFVSLEQIDNQIKRKETVLREEKRANDLDKKVEKPKIVLTWAPHPKALPQAVPNSFAEGINMTDYEFVITHPKGYELAPEFVGRAKVEYDQRKAFEGADFIYAKNWSAYSGDNYGQILCTDRDWTVDSEKMALTNNAFFMHCLPVRRNMIVTDEVIESPESLVIPEAANRVVSAQTILKEILGNL